MLIQFFFNFAVFRDFLVFPYYKKNYWEIRRMT